MSRLLSLIRYGWIIILGVMPACDEPSGAGPCEHNVLEPILKVSSVRDKSTCTDIPEVYVYDIILDSVRLDENDSLEDVLTEGGENSTVFSIGSQTYVECTVPCTFGAGEGYYTFMVLADGYQEKELSLDVEYSHFDGGCPSYEWGPVNLNIELDSAYSYSLEISNGTYQSVLPDSEYAVTFDYAVYGTKCWMGGYGIKWHPDAFGHIDYYALMPVLPGVVYTVADTFNMRSFTPDSVTVEMQCYLRDVHTGKVHTEADPNLRAYCRLELIE
ncbi:MAG: hypothetical protein JSU77_05740 [Fidelibacterota bacterium]|nr:MAG: hypothetical protein JSU77_05740 [Candidatus Neomarinimicrobiota bacterium]